MIAGFFRLFFKDIFYNILIKIYYNVFRIKKNDLTKKAINEMTRNQSVYFFISVLTIGAVAINLINLNQIKAAENNISKTVLTHIILPEFDTVTPEILIEETAIPNNVLLAKKAEKSYQPDLLNKEPLVGPGENTNQNNLPIFNDENNLVFKPLINVGSNNDFENGNNATSSQRLSTIDYVVKAGDTVSGIANYFNLTVNTILWANNLTAYSLIQPGAKLTILPASGILYNVKSGDTVSGIANRYSVDADKILSANNLESGLKINQKIIIPGARPISTYVAKAAVSSTSNNSGLSVIRDLIQSPVSKTSGSGMAWPTVGHYITQYYSWRHTGVDIANKIGTPIYAADNGIVLVAQGGWNGGYGNTVLLDNGGNIRTRYGHASKLLVKPGEKVVKGQIIALMGSTGRSTGPHLHFEVLIKGARTNPLNYVR